MTIAVDVDGTLSLQGECNQELLAWCRARRAEGYTLILWSAQGHQHAENTARAFDAVDAFDYILSKPSYVVDDKGWSWTAYTRVIRSLRELAPVDDQATYAEQNSDA